MNTFFTCRDDQSYLWSYEVRADGCWRRPGGNWKDTDNLESEMGSTFAQRHSEALARLTAEAECEQ